MRKWEGLPHLDAINWSSLGYVQGRPPGLARGGAGEGRRKVGGAEQEVAASCRHALPVSGERKSALVVTIRLDDLR